MNIRLTSQGEYMGRRKGELSNSTIDREFPHQVMVLASQRRPSHGPISCAPVNAITSMFRLRFKPPESRAVEIGNECWSTLKERLSAKMNQPQ